jgi:hypothetical protein
MRFSLATAGLGVGLRHNMAVQPIDPTPSAEEAAAIVAALERFMRATAPPPVASAPVQLDGWHAAALLEGVSRDPWADGRADGDGWLATPSQTPAMARPRPTPG